jgi:hypothetical protein
MLNDEVVEAVRNGQFSIWQVRTIDEGIEILTGVPAGVRDEQGTFPEGSVHRLVEDRLRDFAEAAMSFSRQANDGTVPVAPGPIAQQPNE